MEPFLTTFGQKKTKSPLFKEAYALYNASDYKEAEPLFRSLIQEHPLDKKTWFGLASTLMMQKKYEEALMPWAMTALLEDNDPLPHFHAAECLFSLGQQEEAKKALALAEERARYDEAPLALIQALKERCLP